MTRRKATKTYEKRLPNLYVLVYFVTGLLDFRMSSVCEGIPNFASVLSDSWMENFKLKTFSTYLQVFQWPLAMVLFWYQRQHCELVKKKSKYQQVISSLLVYLFSNEKPLPCHQGLRAFLFLQFSVFPSVDIACVQPAIALVKASVALLHWTVSMSIEIKRLLAQAAGCDQ